jgi:hypothetical protein
VLTKGVIIVLFLQKIAVPGRIIELEIKLESSGEKRSASGTPIISPKAVISG